MLANINSKLKSIEFDIKSSIEVACHSSNIVKHWMSKLKKSPETVKLSNLLNSLCDKVEAIDKARLVNIELENDVVTLLGRVVTLRQSQRSRGRNHLSEDDFLALETVCNALKKVENAISEVRVLCLARNDLKGRLCQLQREDGLSLWLKDLDRLELFIKVD